MTIMILETIMRGNLSPQAVPRPEARHAGSFCGGKTLPAEYMQALPLHFPSCGARRRLRSCGAPLSKRL